MMRKLLEANSAEKILKDPRMTKMLALAVKHDHSFPHTVLAKLGPRPRDEELVQAWSELLDKTLSNTQYGDLSREGKFDAWLTRLYLNHANNYEDINGEGGDALGAWRALSIRNLLEPQDQDFNRFPSIGKLIAVTRKQNYREALRKIADAEKLATMKRDSKQVVLINNDEYYVAVPLNYGSCYTFNNSEGIQASFCTGSSTGLTWFERYSRDGPMVDILDKNNMNNKEGKWQMHTATRQLNNAVQDNNRYGSGETPDQQFARLFPGLMRDIAGQLSSHAEQLKNGSKDIARDGWNIPEEVERIKRVYPLAYASTKDDATEENGDLDHLFGGDRG
jgi:hypothetical protein